MKKINYKVFLWTGISLILAGIPYIIAVNKVLGLAFIAIGASHIAIALSKRDQMDVYVLL